MRRLWVFIHRWTGLVMAGFLIIVGLTGSLLAFYNELDHLVAPQLFATPRPGIAPLDAATLTERVEALAPEARVTGVWLWYPDQVLVSVGGRIDPETNQPHELAYDQLLLDPWTGNELGRRAWGDISQGSINLMSFVYKLHYALALGMPGIWILGFVALAWTIDCFVGFYLTLPVGHHKFWKRWKPAWQIKAGAGVFRLNFDLHRAAGLWLWGVLLVFAWSSVYMNLWDTVYTWATRAVLEYHAPWTELVDRPQPLKTPRLDWREAQSVGERLMAEAAASHGFSVENPIALSFDSKKGLYRYGVRSSKDIQDHRGKTDLYFDGETGAMTLLLLPTGQFAGNTVTSWIYALHMGNIFGLPWRIFVCGLGLVVVLLSVTGVYIWWKKRSARKLARSRKRLPTEIDDAETAAYGRSKPA
ncbi:peptidase [Beijerinckiaceae bacterium]|nr:peptidase [Beijerinckiaceae bacterium]